MSIILFSSDSTQQYKKDIMNVIAAAQNTKYRFRYKAHHIENTMLSRMKSNSLNGEEALIVFRANSDELGDEPFIVPVRWAVIESTYYSDEICIITFIIKDYPEFTREFKGSAISKEGNIEYSREFFTDNASNKYVLDNTANIVSFSRRSNEQQELLWIDIIEALKYHDAFKETVFFRTILPQNKKENFPYAMVIKEDEYKEIELWHYCPNDAALHTSTIQIQYDTNYLNSVLGVQDNIECKYDKINYGFQAIKSGNNLKSQIVFKISRLDNNSHPIFDTETKILVPVIIEKSHRRIIHAILTGLGSLALATASALTTLKINSVPIWIIFPLLALGAFAPPVSLLIFNKK